MRNEPAIRLAVQRAAEGYPRALTTALANLNERLEALERIVDKTDVESEPRESLVEGAMVVYGETYDMVHANRPLVSPREAAITAVIEYIADYCERNWESRGINTLPNFLREELER